MKPNAQFPRRDFLRGAAAATTLALAARSARSFTTDRHFAPVKVSRERVIREVVGLRPYRAQGFVVEATRLDHKTLIHNYGHGGAGITLSWGTASLAADLAQGALATTSQRRRLRNRFAVIGCGVNGLSTARLIQRRFQNGPGAVTIYAKTVPPDTTSNIAGGFWSPTSLYDQSQVAPGFSARFRLACHISNKAFQLLVGNEYGVRWIETFERMRNEPSFSEELPGGNDLYPQIEIHRDPERYFGFPFVKQYNTMLIEPSIYLNALLRDFYIAGGSVVIKEFRSREELLRLPEPIIFNCTGLGARDLFGDQDLGPVRGQLEVLLPQPEIDYCYLSRGYMFPRHDGIVLGGTFDHDNWSLTPDPEQAAAILETHAAVMKALK
jgi:glycine/D-amino acid oxidase-like deaminating enzyme